MLLLLFSSLKPTVYFRSSLLFYAVTKMYAVRLFSIVVTLLQSTMFIFLTENLTTVNSLGSLKSFILYHLQINVY